MKLKSQLDTRSEEFRANAERMRGLVTDLRKKVERPGEAGFFDPSFSLANYVRAFGSGGFWQATWNTLYFAIASTALSFGLGTFLAWVVHRTNTPFARLIGVITLGRIIIPGILITVSWILLASPSIGVLNHALETLTGIKRLLNIYSFWGMVWVHSLEITPLAYLLLSAALQSMDPRLEEASSVAGAGQWATLRRVSLPLILPAVSAAVMLLLIYSVETFEVPLLLGGGVRPAAIRAGARRHRRRSRLGRCGSLARAWPSHGSSPCDGDRLILAEGHGHQGRVARR